MFSKEAGRWCGPFGSTHDRFFFVLQRFWAARSREHLEPWWIIPQNFCFFENLRFSIEFEWAANSSYSCLCCVGPRRKSSESSSTSLRAVYRPKRMSIDPGQTTKSRFYRPTFREIKLRSGKYKLGNWLLKVRQPFFGKFKWINNWQDYLEGLILRKKILDFEFCEVI